MVQEVQQQWNWYQTPNRIQWIWISERKVSDHTQVRNKRTNWCRASTSITLQSGNEVKSSSWTISDDNTVKYKTRDGKIYIPLAWTYLFRFTLANWYSVSYTEKFRIYSGKRLIYTYNTNLSDKTQHDVLLNLGRKNEISISLYYSWWDPWQVLTLTPRIQIIKL